MSLVELWKRVGTELVGHVLIGFAGKRNDDEDAKEKLYTYASFVPVLSFKVRQSPSLFLPASHISNFHLQGLETTVVDAE